MTEKFVLITGAAGFIGRHVALEYSRNDWNVVGIGRGEWSDWHNYGLTAWHRADVTIDSLLEYGGKPDVIVHCAGGASVGASVEHPANDFDLTVRTTSDVLEFIRSHTKFSKLIYPSSAAVYGQVNSLPIIEDTPLNPISPYGVHKKMAEDLCRLYAQQFELSVAVVRLFSIYGAGLRKQLLWDACRKFKEGECSFFGTGNEVRDWLHVRDVAKLLFAAAQNASIICPFVNAGSGQGVPVKDILFYLSNQFGRDNSPMFSSKPKAGDPNAYIADISKALAWNWEPKIKWQEGLAEYVEWYKQCQ